MYIVYVKCPKIYEDTSSLPPSQILYPAQRGHAYMGVYAYNACPGTSLPTFALRVGRSHPLSPPTCFRNRKKKRDFGFGAVASWYSAPVEFNAESCPGSVYRRHDFSHYVLGDIELAHLPVS